VKPTPRELWRREQEACFWSGCKANIRNGDIMECHEIIGGSDRAKTILLPAFWLWLCREHHNQLSSRPSQESLIEQLAVKKWADPERYDPAKVIKMWRPNCTPELVREIVALVGREYRRIARDFA